MPQNAACYQAYYCLLTRNSIQNEKEIKNIVPGTPKVGNGIFPIDMKGISIRYICVNLQNEKSGHKICCPLQ